MTRKSKKDSKKKVKKEKIEKKVKEIKEEKAEEIKEEKAEEIKEEKAEEIKEEKAEEKPRTVRYKCMIPGIKNAQFGDFIIKDGILEVPAKMKFELLKDKRFRIIK